METRPVSVAFVSSYGRRGGSEVYLERLLSRLEPAWINCPIILLGEGPLADRLRGIGHSVDIIPTSRAVHSMLVSSWKLRRRLLVSRPDVVHANGLKAVLVTVVAALGTSLPVLWARHDFGYEGWRARMLARMCRRVVCVSHALTRTFRGSLRHKTHVVYTGMPEVNVDRGAARAHLSSLLADVAEPLIVLVGELNPIKGHMELIEIAPQLLQRLPNARILFVGGSPPGPYGAAYLTRLERRIERLGTAGRITLLGYRDDALTLMAGADVVVMPSITRDANIETEGFPLVALETLALGVPLVAYAVGGLPELVGDCAVLVQPEDRDELLESIVGVTANRDRWEHLSACGRDRVRTCFSMGEMVEKMGRIYRLARRG